MIGEFVGVDNVDLTLQEARKAAQSYPNVKLEKINLEDIAKHIQPNTLPIRFVFGIPWGMSTMRLLY